MGMLDALQNFWVLFWTDVMWAFMILCPMVGISITYVPDGLDDGAVWIDALIVYSTIL